MKIFLLLALVLPIHGQIRSGLSRPVYQPTPSHIYVDTVQHFDSTTNALPVSTTQLNTGQRGGSGGFWEMGNTNSLNWVGVSGSDLTFPVPVRVGGNILRSSGIKWIQYSVTNGGC